MLCRREWLPTPVFLPGKCYGQRSLADSSPRGCKESDTMEGPTLSLPPLTKNLLPDTNLSHRNYFLPTESLGYYAQIRVIISNPNLARLGWAQAPPSFLLPQFPQNSHQEPLPTQCLDKNKVKEIPKDAQAPFSPQRTFGNFHHPSQNPQCSKKRRQIW